MSSESASRGQSISIGRVTPSVTEILSLVSREEIRIDFDDGTLDRVRRAAKAFDEIDSKNQTCYGINTSFGALVGRHVDPSHAETLQRKLAFSHCIGKAKFFDRATSRIIFFLRLNYLAQGTSGITEETFIQLVKLFNYDVTPRVPCEGSLGASGDLGPLAEFASFFLGKGFGWHGDNFLSSREIHESLRHPMLDPKRKEILSLINGTTASAAVAAIATARAQRAFETYLAAFSLHCHTFNLSTSFVNSAAFELKPHAGAKAIIAFLRYFLHERSLQCDSRSWQLQESYSTRCLPLILGPVVTSIKTLREAVEIEMNSANDNPLFLPSTQEIYHGGHFHGHSISVPLDQFRIAFAHVSGLIDRQLESVFVSKGMMNGDNPFLSVSPDTGDTGLMGVQYLVSSLHARNLQIVGSCSTTTSPTNAGNQDYVSLSLQSAISTLEMVENTERAIEVLILTSLQMLSLADRSDIHPELNEIARYISADLELPYNGDRPISELLAQLNSRLSRGEFPTPKGPSIFS